MNTSNFILYYHAIGDMPMSVSIDEFDGIINRLSKDFQLITVSELISLHYKKRETRGLCSITFDDYFQSAQINGLPILDKYNAKGTFYTTVDYIGKSLWGNPSTDRWNIEKKNGYDIEFPMMDLRNLNELVARGHEVGCHTMSHPNLIECSYENTIMEIHNSKKILEKKLGITIKSFAYPRGIFGEREKTIVKDTGFENGVTTIKNLVDKSEDIFSVTRFPGPISANHLEYLLSGKIERYKIKILNGLKHRFRKLRLQN